LTELEGGDFFEGGVFALSRFVDIVDVNPAELVEEVSETEFPVFSMLLNNSTIDCLRANVATSNAVCPFLFLTFKFTPASKRI